MVASGRKSLSPTQILLSTAAAAAAQNTYADRIEVIVRNERM